VAVEGGFSFATISAGTNHTCGVELDTGLVGCWGSNAFGQLGDGTLTDRDHPVPVLATQ
jgi:alpha-tubulin suppressor-like RCC1 family protein